MSENEEVVDCPSVHHDFPEVKCDVTWKHGSLHSNMTEGLFWVSAKVTPAQSRQATMAAMKKAARKNL